MIPASLLPGWFRLLCLVTVLVNATALAHASSNIDKSESQQEVLSISAVGDIMMGSTFPVPVLPPNDGSSLFEGVKDFLKGDIVFGNLEGPLVEDGQPRKCRKDSINCYEFSMPPRYAQHLVNAGFNVMNIANNHLYDFGERGVSSTLDALGAAGIKTAGCGRVARFEARGKNIALVGFTFSASASEWGSVLNIEGATRIIHSVKALNNIVIVSFHAGGEGKNALHVTGRNETFAGEHRGNVREFGRAAVEAGADLVIGHGPHVLRAIEVYRNKLIAYSLGNFLTYGMFNIKGPNGLGVVLQVRIDWETGDFLSGRLIPLLLQQGGIPQLDQGQGSINLVRALTLEDFGSKAIGMSEDGELYPIR
jgi:hypothetical protein